MVRPFKRVGSMAIVVVALAIFGGGAWMDHRSDARAEARLSRDRAAVEAAGTTLTYQDVSNAWTDHLLRKSSRLRDISRRESPSAGRRPTRTKAPSSSSSAPQTAASTCSSARPVRPFAPATAEHLPSTGSPSYLPLLESAVCDVTLADSHTEQLRVSGYVQEAPSPPSSPPPRRRSTIDSLCERVASFRTADIRRVLRRDPRPLRAVDLEDRNQVAAFEASAG